MPALEELGIAFVPFSPLGKGILTGRFTADSKLDAADFRAGIPRFQGENYQHNLELANYVKELARLKDAAPAQIALAWVLAQKDFIVPIPGTKKVGRIKENLGSMDITFTEKEMSNIREKLESIEIIGARYPEAHQKLVK